MLIARFCLFFLFVALVGCASTGGIPREPFADIRVPASFVPYSDQWALIRTPQVAAAKLVYMTSLSPDAALSAVRQELAKHGWTSKEPTHFVNPQGFSGFIQEFVKGTDACRVTVIEGPYSTHVDLAVARLTSR